MKHYMHFINGKYVEPDTGQYFFTENPFSGMKWAKTSVNPLDRVAQEMMATQHVIQPTSKPTKSPNAFRA